MNTEGGAEQKTANRSEQNNNRVFATREPLKCHDV